MAFNTNSPPERSADKKPSKEAYDTAFDEIVLALFTEYRKLKQAEAAEPTEE